MTLGEPLTVERELLGVGCVAHQQRFDVFGVIGVELRLDY